MRILLDTNVLIAAFVSHGTCSELLEHCVTGHDVLVCEFILTEFKEKLLKKFHFDPGDVEQALGLLSERLTCVEVSIPIERVCRDRDDDTVLAAALAGKCDFLITGDKDLLVLGMHRSVRIITPAEFWRLVS